MAKVLLNFRVDRELYSKLKERAELEKKTLSDYLRDNLPIHKNFEVLE